MVSAVSLVLILHMSKHWQYTDTLGGHGGKLMGLEAQVYHVLKMSNIQGSETMISSQSPR